MACAVPNCSRARWPNVKIAQTGSRREARRLRFNRLLIVLARVCRFSMRTSAVTLMILGAFLSGCGDSTKPEAIWCETGTGPGEVVYPRPITYDANLDNFYVIDRVAHVQRLDRNGRCLCE